MRAGSWESRLIDVGSCETVVADGNERRWAGQMKVFGVRQERANECPVFSGAQRLNDEAQGAKRSGAHGFPTMESGTKNCKRSERMRMPSAYLYSMTYSLGATRRVARRGSFVFRQRSSLLVYSSLP